MRRAAIVLTLAIFGCLFSSGCGILKPIASEAGDATVQWWKEKGQAQVAEIAKAEAVKAADSAALKAEDYARVHRAEIDAKMQAGTATTRDKILYGIFGLLGTAATAWLTRKVSKRIEGDADGDGIPDAIPPPIKT